MGARKQKIKIKKTNLEEIDLNGAVGEVQDDGALRSEPQGQIRHPCQLVSFPPCHVGAGLQQVLAHVIAEVFQQRYLQRRNKCGTMCTAVDLTITIRGERESVCGVNQPSC